MFLLIGSIVVTITATAAAVIFDKERKKLEKENEELSEKINTYKSELEDLEEYKINEQRKILKEKFFILKDKIFGEIDSMYQEKIKIKNEIESCLKKINKELAKSSLNDFYKAETYKSRNLLIYGLSKIDAYFRYLNFYKYQINKFEKQKKYHLIFELPKIEAFLPDEYLFKGKLLEIREDEFNKYNQFSQRLVLNPKDQKYLSKSNIVLIEDYNPYEKVFIGSISKGELALHYENKTFFETEALEDEKKSSIVLKYKNLDLFLNKNEKRLNRKITKGEKVNVRIKGSDYLLNNIFVTEREEENLRTLFIVGDTKFKFAEIVDVEEDKIYLFSDNKVICAEFKNKYAKIIKIEDRVVYEKIEPPVNLKFVTFEEFEVIKNLITYEEFKETKDYLLLSISAKKSDNQFIDKYISLLDYQISNNQYRTYYTYYTLIDKINGEYILKINLDFEVEKSAYVEIGGKDYLLKDYSKEDSFIKIDAIEDIPSSGNLIIYSYSYPYALIQQRKALNKFLFGQIVNKNIKNILINPKLKKYSPIFKNLKIDFKNKNLTPNQKEIVKKALNERDLFLIQGPPGTGKTTVIKEIIYQSKKLNLAKNILIVSQQNVAVDNVLEGVKKEQIDNSIIRIASLDKKVYESLKEDIIEYKFQNYQKELLKKLNNINEESKLSTYRRFWYSLIENKTFKQVDESLKEFFIKNHKLVGATCVGLANEKIGLDFSEFDLVIIDEAGRATLGELLIPILKAKKVILIGDHKQLPPNTDKTLLEKIERDEGFSKEDLKILEKSYFEELYENLDDSSKAMLNEQFRMPNKIGSLISKIFYEDRLKNGRNYEIKDALNWIDVRGEEKREGTSKFNKKEAKIIARMVNKFRDKSIAIITPYSAQKRLLRKLIKGNNIKIDTIDSFQGEEADIVFYSLVRNRGNIQFLLDMRRLNVAISRTREKLFFVGNKSFFNRDKLFRKIIKEIENL